MASSTLLPIATSYPSYTQHFFLAHLFSPSSSTLFVALFCTPSLLPSLLFHPSHIMRYYLSSFSSSPALHDLFSFTPCRAGMAACSLGLTRYVYSKTYKASTLNFGILTTTGFTLSAYVLSLLFSLSPCLHLLFPFY